MMKMTFTALVVCAAIALGTTASGARQATEQEKKSPPEVVLTGCIVQGSSPTVFIFDNAKKDPNSTLEKGVKYLLVSTVEDVNLRTHLNHAVRVVGEVEVKVTAQTTTTEPQRPVEERNLPTLKAKSLTMVSDTCSVAR